MIFIPSDTDIVYYYVFESLHGTGSSFIKRLVLLPHRLSYTTCIDLFMCLWAKEF